MRQEEKESLNLIKSWLESNNYNVNFSDQGGQTKYLSYDIICSKLGVNKYVEVKKRRFSVSDFLKYSNKGLIYENTKYQFLKDKFGYYINIINLNGVDYIFIWYVGVNTQLSFNWFYKFCKTTTDFKNNKYTEKLITYVYPRDAQIIKCEDNEYKKITYNDLINELQNGNN